MPTYALLRDYDPTMTRAQIDGIVLAGGAALQTYTFRGDSQPHAEPHGISWVRSYWQQGGSWGMCVFEAPNLAVLSGFQELCGTPFRDAMEVEEVSGTGSGPAPSQVALTLKLPGAGQPSDEIGAAVAEAAPGVIRAYYSAARNTAVTLLANDQASALPSSLDPVAGVVELQPVDYQ